MKITRGIRNGDQDPDSGRKLEKYSFYYSILVLGLDTNSTGKYGKRQGN